MRRVFFVFAVFVGFASSIDPAAAHGSISTACLPGELKATLNHVEAKFGPVQVISSHRPGARVRGTGRRSKHADCRAVDFHPAKGQHAAVVAWLRANHSGGLGTYSGRHSHIHIDNGGDHTWHNGSGKRTRLARGRGGSRSASARRGGSSRYASTRRGGGSRTASARRGGRGVAVAGYRSRSRAASRRASRATASSRGRRYASRSDRNRAERRGGDSGVQSQASKLPGYQG